MACNCEDLNTIHGVLAGIAQHNDVAAWDEYGALFTDDGILHCFGRDYEGRDAIVKFTSRRHIGKHMLSLPIIAIDGDHATAITDYTFYRYPDLVLFGVGVYNDDLVKQGDTWLMARREIVVHGHHEDMTAAAKQHTAPIADTMKA
jgi:SnoaL-like domain